MTAIDYRLAFDLAPIGLVLSSNRSIVDCNARLCEMFAQSRELLIGQTFQVLYPSRQEYERTGERIAPILNKRGDYADAEAQLKKAVGLYGKDPGVAEIWVHLGAVYEKKNEIEKAKDAYRKALSIQPGNKDAAEALKRLAPP